MRVALDVSPLATDHQFRGIGVYTQSLKDAFKQSNISGLIVELIKDGKVPDNCDLIHYPYFDLFFKTLPFQKDKPSLVTIHDVIPLVLKDFYKPGLRGNLKLVLQKMALKNVKAIITDSQNSKKDIFKYLNYPLKKIHVVYLAPASHFGVIKDEKVLERISKKYNLPEKFILYVGDVNYNKNIPGLIKAFADLPKDVCLVLVGKAFLEDSLKENIEISKLIESLKIEDRVIRLGYLPNTDLTAIYNLASVYCQPSFYEGFGLPVLEAMACGCPVASANISSLPEICGQAAVMFDPYKIDDMIKGLQRALANKKELSQKGLRQVKKFSWDKTAKKTYEVYQKVV